MILFFVIIYGVFGKYSKEMKFKSLELNDLLNKCFDESYEVLQEFQFLNNIFVNQVLPDFEENKARRSKDLIEVVEFLEDYNDLLVKLSTGLETEYLNNKALINGSEYVIKELKSYIDSVIDFVEEYKDKKTSELYSVEFQEELDEFIDFNTKLIFKHIVESFGKSKEEGFERIYYFDPKDSNQMLFKEIDLSKANKGLENLNISKTSFNEIIESKIKNNLS